jgi:hypothetical protein
MERATGGAVERGWLRGDRFVYALLAISSVVIGLVILFAIVTGSGSGGTHGLPLPTPAPVGP